jgi:hypothetical protein
MAPENDTDCCFNYDVVLEVSELYQFGIVMVSLPASFAISLIVDLLINQYIQKTKKSTRAALVRCQTVLFDSLNIPSFGLNLSNATFACVVKKPWLLCSVG